MAEPADSGCPFCDETAPHEHEIGEAKPQSDNIVLRRVYFIRQGDPKGSNHRLAIDALRELTRWLERGYGFDIVLERQDEESDRARKDPTVHG